MNIQEFIKEINDRLERYQVFADPSQPYEEWSKDYLLRGGKRLRPAIVWAVFESLRSTNWELAIQAGLAIELIHNATLVEDDWMDRDQERRGEPTLHVLRSQESQGFAKVGLADHYGRTMATLVTNVLQSAASKQIGAAAATLETGVEIITYFEEAVTRVIEGQMREFGLQERMLQGEVPQEEEIMEMMDAKTATLFRLACWLGAKLNNEDTESWEKTGYNLGLAFQMYDDLMNINQSLASKRQLGDILEMKPNLLNSRLLNLLNTEEREEWLKGVEERSPEMSDRIATLMQERGLVTSLQEEVEKRSQAVQEEVEGVFKDEGATFMLSLIKDLKSRI